MCSIAGVYGLIYEDLRLKTYLWLTVYGVFVQDRLSIVHVTIDYKMNWK